MNAPLIVVQGDLLVPTLFPLAGMPFADYGEEWTLHAARPALTEYEIPFYAARLITAYISRLALQNDRFPYTPASLWGNFRRGDETNLADQPVADHFPLRQTEFEPTAPIEAVKPTQPAVEPPPVAFKSVIDDDEPPQGPPPPPPSDRRKQVAGGAIALACAAFIAWAMFAPKSGHRVEPTSAPPQLAANPPVPAIKQNENDTKREGASAAASGVASTPAVVSANEPASATVVAASPEVATPAAVVASRGAVALTSPVEPILQPRPVHQVTRRVAPVVVKKTHVTARARREAHRYEHVHRRHGYRAEPVYRSAEHATPLVSPGRRKLASHDGQTGAAGYASPSIPEMYNMLAHSAVLDDNSGGSRMPSRRSASGETSNYTVDLNQRRLTDAPSQFSK